MTYYDEAELVYLFSGAAGKPGNGISRAYSFKPDNKDVIINRGSNLAATRIGKDGFLEKGRENLLINTVWAGAAASVAGNKNPPTGYASHIEANTTSSYTPVAEKNRSV